MNNEHIDTWTDPVTPVKEYAVEETVPAGLTPANISESGVWDSVNRKVRWGPWNDDVPRTLSYDVAGNSGTYAISGLGNFDAQTRTTTGDSQVTIAVAGIASTIVRSINNGGTESSVSLVATPVSVTAYAVEETLPAGLMPANISSSGVWNSGQRKVSWVFIDGTARTLSYTVSGAAGSYTLSGIAVFGTEQIGISGDTQVVIGQ